MDAKISSFSHLSIKILFLLTLIVTNTETVAQPNCLDDTLLEPYQLICAPVTDRTKNSLADSDSNNSAPSVQVDIPDGLPIPFPGDFGAGIEYKLGTLQVLDSTRFVTKMYVHPEGLEADGPVGFFFTVIGGRVQKGVEPVGLYTDNPDGALGLFDWSCSPEYPCENGESGPSWVQINGFENLACSMKEIVDDGGHAQTIILASNDATRLSNESPPHWINQFFLWNYCEDTWDLLYEHEYRVDQVDCSLTFSNCARYANWIETHTEGALPKINELGFEDARIMHDGVWSQFNDNNSTFYNNVPLWETFHLQPDRSYGVGNFTKLPSEPPITELIVNGNVVSFPIDGNRWKLWDRINLINVCLSWVDGYNCTATPGRFAAVNVTTGERYLIEIEEGHAELVGNVVTFPDDGSQWKLWDRIHLTNVCLSWVDGPECIAAPGSYAIVNVTTGSRQFIEIEAGEPTVDGNIVTFPDDGGQWKLWDRIDSANVCLSWVDGLECVADPGSYTIVNVTLGERENIVIADQPLDSGESIAVDNFENADIVGYALPLLSGTAPGADTIIIEHNGSSTSWNVNEGRWRAFVSLQDGENELSMMSDNGDSISLKLIYQPMDNEQVVRMVYLLGSDSAGVFDAPPGVGNTLDDAVVRLKLAGRLLQSLTAEFLSESGQPRKTFSFLRDADHYPLVDIQVSPLSIAELQTMDGVELWFHFEELMRGILDRNNVIDIAVIADTHFDPAVNPTVPLAHTARGGFPLGLFGSASVHSWPTAVDEIGAKFTDPTLTEAFLFPEFGRSSQYWSNATTSLGAMLHEMGHAFGIGFHTDDPSTIMNRGFDYLNRAIVTFEPEHGAIDPDVDRMPRWDDSSVEILINSPWFELPVISDSSEPIVDGNTITFPDNGDRWKLWDRIHFVNMCLSWVDDLECLAAPGSYAIVNVTTGSREFIEIEAGEPTVDGNIITFPDDGGQWKLWDRINSANVCLSWLDGLVCIVDSGSYAIVNVSTGSLQLIEI